MQKRLKIIFINILVSLLLLEICAAIFTRVLGYYAPPTYITNKTPKSADINPDFGVWHIPNTEFRHARKCFDVTNKYNSYGARDRERDRTSNNLRIINIGDSFIEGFGVTPSHRLSNILETKTRKEILNFGTSGSFGSTQMRLLYETMASNFSHDILLLGLFPNNDFEDDNIELGKELYFDRYRPYLVNNEIKYIVEDIEDSRWSTSNSMKKPSRESLKKTLSEYTHLGKIYFQHFHAIPNKKHKIETKRKFYSGLTRFKDFNTTEISILKQNLKRISEIAGDDRKVIVFTIPAKIDLRRYLKNPNLKDFLTPQLKQFCNSNNMIYVDLKAAFLKDIKDKEDINKYYFSCDAHWSPEGHKKAADIIQPILLQTIDSIEFKKAQF